MYFVVSRWSESLDTIHIVMMIDVFELGIIYKGH